MYKIYCCYSPNPKHTKHWRLDEEHTRHNITVPAGFKWNSVSTPRILLPLIPRWGLYSSAALIHDYLYSMRGDINNEVYTRRQSDDIFYKIMIEDGVNKFKARIMWLFVRATGWKVWNIPKP